MAIIESVLTDAHPALVAISDAVVLVKQLLGKAHDADAKIALCGVLDKLLASQEKSLQLLDENRRLKAELESLKRELATLHASHEQASRYALAEFAPGVVFGQLKQCAANGEKPHCACPKCLADGAVGRIQLSDEDGFLPRGLWNKRDLVCLKCGARFAVDAKIFERYWTHYA